jgi:hypothetical protein
LFRRELRRLGKIRRTIAFEVVVRSK